MQATDRVATGVTYNEVNAAMGLCNDGDRLIIPAGTATWTSALTINKAITIQGAGVGAGGTFLTPAGTLSGNPFWVVNSKANGTTIISDIEFRATSSYTNSGGITNGGFIHTNGSDSNGWQFRLHDCIFRDIPEFCFVPKSTIGVIDHNLFVNVDQIAHINAENWGGFPNGSGSWAAASDTGGIHTTVFEDNEFNKDFGCSSQTFFDARQGGRSVIRHNTFDTPCTGAIITMHGLENNSRGTRLTEVYDNLFIRSNQARLGNQRAGVQIWFNNIVVGGSGGTKISLTHDRGWSGSHWDNVWGGAYGDNKWDDNDRHGGPSNTNPTPYATVTAASGSGTNSLVVSGTPWTGIDWTGYTIKLVGGTAGGVVTGNTSNTITTTGDGQFGSPLVVSSGQQYKILRVLSAMDMVGRGGGSQVDSGSSAVPSGWNNQVTEGCYEWNNVKKTSGNVGSWGSAGTTDIDFEPDNPTIRSVAIGSSPAHYHNDTPKPGYPWSSGATARVGATGSGPWGGQPTTTQTVTGGDYNGCYPHPLVTGAPCGSAPQPAINSASTATFSTGTTGQTFTVTTANFSGTPTVTIGSWSPSTPSNVNFGAPNCAANTFCGTATGTVAGFYTVTITATYTPPSPDEVATQTFILKVESPNAAPTVSLTAPLNGAVYIAPATVVLSATANDTDGTISSVSFYRSGSTLINSAITSVPYTTTWTQVPAGSYSLTAKATDNAGAVTTSSAVSITVNAAVSSPTPPAQIIVKP